MLGSAFFLFLMLNAESCRRKKFHAPGRNLIAALFAVSEFPGIQLRECVVDVGEHLLLFLAEVEHHALAQLDAGEVGLVREIVARDGEIALFRRSCVVQEPLALCEQELLELADILLVHMLSVVLPWKHFGKPSPGLKWILPDGGEWTGENRGAPERS